MEFFKTLSEIGITDVIIQFEITAQKEVTVFVAPKALSTENPLKLINPIYISGLADEVDNTFFDKLSKHMVVANEALKKELAKPKKVVEKLVAAPVVAPEVLEEETVSTEPATVSTEPTAVSTEPIMKVVKEAAESTKEPKVNHEKALKDFVTTIKNDDILIHQVALENLLGVLSDEELKKPFPFKIKNDLEIALRKKANQLAARAKAGYTTMNGEPIPENIIKENGGLTEEQLAEEIANEPQPIFTQKEHDDIVEEETKEEVLESPIVDFAMKAIEEDIPDFDAIAADIEMVQEENLSSPVQTEFVAPVVPTPIPVPAIPKPEVVELVKTFVMNPCVYTYEQMSENGWTDDLLVANGYGEYQMLPSKAPAVPAVPSPLN